ncbi:unnamed protein product [Clonostachys rosea]|uniref:SGNH hydrolase-type esterase domain-containing protein n=1 Tax=Bionectria ochroleuca TaxID=29856 RepID=A0ABY6U9J6_BIOOC|nr:unnamed protein product [Clonostachys rosea]
MRAALKFLGAAGLLAGTTYGRAVQQTVEASSIGSLGEGLQTRDATFPLPNSDQVLLEETAFSSGMLGGVKDIHILQYRNVRHGERAQGGQKLRILGVGDSITAGFLSDQDGGDGSGYRQALRDDLSRNEVVFAGTEYMASVFTDNYFAAWSGKTIKYIADNVDASLEQKPNVVLLSAGTNDMNSRSSISTEGNDPKKAAERLGSLIDKIHRACPDALILVAMIQNVCDNEEYHDQHERTKWFQKYIADVVKVRFERRQPVLAADFSGFDTNSLRDCVHPTNRGYQVMGDWWYDFIAQLPNGWVQEAEGSDPHET